ncbi:TPA: hypothetical protein HA251_04515 [Candidatus Woesearchaeota archaeon]|nr:hypothetical protein [Candidatus Woesearchaeota archaeon]
MFILLTNSWRIFSRIMRVVGLMFAMLTVYCGTGSFSTVNTFTSMMMLFFSSEYLSSISVIFPPVSLRSSVTLVLNVSFGSLMAVPQ